MTDPFHAPPSRSPLGPAVDEHTTPNERTYALWTHLVGFASLSSGSIPFLGLIGTVIMWRIRAADSPFLDDHGREATNFQISLALYYLMGIVFSIVTVGLGATIVFPVLLALSIIGQVRGAMAAHRSEYYRYPCCIRFLQASEEG